MSATGDLIAALIAGGMDAAEAAGMVARAAVEMTGALTKKTPNAVRQQRYRDRNASVTNRNESVTERNADERNETVTNRNESVTRNAPSLSKEEKKEEVKEKREGTRGSRLPENWEPSRADLEAASVLLGPTRADDELAKFRDHWKAQPGSKGVKSDWPATWRNWYRRAVEYGKNRNGNGPSNHRADPAAGRATAREAHHVATMGGAALRYLQEGKSAGPVRPVSDSPGPAEVVDFGRRAENAR